MAYEVYEHAGSFIVINRHTGEDTGLVTPIVSEALSDDACGATIRVGKRDNQDEKQPPVP